MMRSRRQQRSLTASAAAAAAGTTAMTMTMANKNNNSRTKPIHFLACCCLGLVILSVCQTAVLNLQAPPNKDWGIMSGFNDQHNDNDNTMNNDRHNKNQQPKTLALLYPPGLFGGYRNQVLRFVGLISYAQQNNHTQLLLPSLLWTTQYEASGNFHPVPFDMLFDVDHWNSFVPELPLLVKTLEASDCWSNDGTSGVDHNDLIHHNPYYQYLQENKKKQSSNANASAFFVSPLAQTLLETIPFLTPVANISRSLISGYYRSDASSLGSKYKPRKVDYLPLTENCTHPHVYGGGKSAGRLWNDFSVLPKEIPGRKTRTLRNPAAAKRTTRLMKIMSDALQPSSKWREVATHCITTQQQRQQQQSTTTTSSSSSPAHLYVALHARVEVDMMIHKCGKQMEKNLTTIFTMVDKLVQDYNNNNRLLQTNNANSPGDPEKNNLQGVFVAVSRTGMLERTTNEAVQRTATENYKTLLQKSASSSNTTTTTAATATSFFECGEVWMNKWYASQQHPQVVDNMYGSIVPSILNFWIATQAQIFIGVSKSSWSNDVWTTRYYDGKGSSNYEYTPSGIRLLANGGLPEAHKNC
jgi:hypothetical protein